MFCVRAVCRVEKVVWVVVFLDGDAASAKMTFGRVKNRVLGPFLPTPFPGRPGPPRSRKWGRLLSQPLATASRSKRRWQRPKSSGQG